MQTVYAKNRPSPSNEEEYRNAYLKLNSDAAKKDNLDIACVVTLSGVKGHGLMNYSENRSKDEQYHLVYDFIEDSILESVM